MSTISHVSVAHGMGQMLLTDPEGREFGKGGLRVATAAQFERLRSGYRHEFELVEDAP